MIKLALDQFTFKEFDNKDDRAHAAWIFHDVAHELSNCKLLRDHPERILPMLQLLLNARCVALEGMIS